MAPLRDRMRLLYAHINRCDVQPWVSRPPPHPLLLSIHRDIIERSR